MSVCVCISTGEREAAGDGREVHGRKERTQELRRRGQRGRGDPARLRSHHPGDAAARRKVLRQSAHHIQNILTDTQNIHTYIHTYIHAYIHTFSYIYTHTWGSVLQWWLFWLSLYIFQTEYTHTYIYIHTHTITIQHLLTVKWYGNEGSCLPNELLAQESANSGHHVPLGEQGVERSGLAPLQGTDEVHRSPVCPL